MKKYYNMKKYHLLLFFIMAVGTLSAQHPTNLVPVEDWTEGQGSVGSFIAAGDPVENNRQTTLGPHGYDVLGWNCENTVLPNSSGGGFYYDFPVDTDKTYRYSVWVRKNDLIAGNSYLWGANNTTYKLDGSAGGANVFWYGVLPSEDEWYLMVSFVHRESYTGTVDFGGVYDSKGRKVFDATDFKWKPNITTGRIYAFTYNVPTGNSQDFYAPRVEVVNGNEPSLSSLMGFQVKETGNLLPVEDWNEGTGSISTFMIAGSDSENARVLGTDPHGESSILWKATSSGNGSLDGGWESEFPIDHQKSYRYSVWMKRGVTVTGNSYFGALSDNTGETLRLDGTTESNPYFWSGQLPELDKWYLLIGYVHGSGYTQTTSIGGVYDGETGEKVMNAADYKSSSTAMRQVHRTFLYDISTAGVTQEYWGARVDPLDGNEPTIHSMLGISLTEEVSGNLLPVEDWNVGTGSVAGFNINGDVGENERVLDVDPHDETSVIWRGTASGNSGGDGGWNYDFPVDHTKTYRLSVWLKKSSTNGNSYLGAHGSGTLNLDGSSNTNPYFWNGVLPEIDKWYLLVGYIHGSSYSGSTSMGGIYDGETGEKVIAATDFKNSTTTTTQRHRAYLFYATTAGTTQDFWGARAEMVDGNEPTIPALLGIDNGPHVWSEITDGAVYNDGSVGIGIDVNDMDPAYKLLVDGDIKTRKVKVTLDGWADHVFDQDYPLLPLEEVETYISQHKHLPGIPSEDEILEEGLYLGEANRLLLQKIEELTLYSIEMKKEMKAMQVEIKLLQEKNKELQKEPSK